MMNNIEIIAVCAALAILAVRLYQKYSKKNSDKIMPGSKNLSGSNFTSASKDDDYEPYSKK